MLQAGPGSIRSEESLPPVKVEVVSFPVVVDELREGGFWQGEEEAGAVGDSGCNSEDAYSGLVEIEVVNVLGFSSGVDLESCSSRGLEELEWAWASRTSRNSSEVLLSGFGVEWNLDVTCGRDNEKSAFDLVPRGESTWC